MYSSQPPLKLLSKNRCGWFSLSRRWGGPLKGILLTSVHRAKWMNDKRPSVPLDFGKCVANQNTSGSHSRPSGLTVLNTVMAIA